MKIEKISNINTLKNQDLFNLIFICQKELLKRGIKTKFEDLRIKELMKSKKFLDSEKLISKSDLRQIAKRLRKNE